MLSFTSEKHGSMSTGLTNPRIMVLCKSYQFKLSCFLLEIIYAVRMRIVDNNDDNDIKTKNYYYMKRMRERESDGED